MGIDVIDSPLGGHPRREPLIPHGVLGMLVLVFCEVMFFAGQISAFIIARASTPGGVWPPYGQPTLPAAETAINTVALLLSGAALVFAHVRFQKDFKQARLPVVLALGLGIFFVAFQGAEWLALLEQGLTMQSSQAGSFFYLIVGSHALHAVAALLGLGWCTVRLFAGKLKPTELWAVETFWYFVVLVWPILYVVVYF